MSVSGVCLAVQQALIAGERPAGLTEHLASCSVCDRVRRLSEMIVARSRGAAHVSISQAFAPGQELLRYRLDALVGEGGQGVVFKATELDVPGSVVALKIVGHDASGTDDTVKEVAFAKRINHPNVCRVHHTAIFGSFRVIEMEYVSGGTLADRLAAGPLDRAEAMRLFRGVLAGMQAVHRHQILHLDLKPLNVLLRDDGEPVVTDFGMAMRPGVEGAGGTAGWTAPEVRRGEPADVRADVYSLGGLLGALLPDRSDAIAAVVARATAAGVADRYPDLEALGRAIDEAAAGGAAGAARRALVIGTAVAMVVCAAVAAGGSWRRAVSSAGSISAAPTLPASEAMVPVPAGTFEMGSPDGEGASDERPQHAVRVAAFEMDRHEVTVLAYDACVRAGRCTRAPGEDVSRFCNEGHADRALHPINCVDWNQADAFCRWAGKRLPTEEEWEYAARGSAGREWPWGAAPPSAQLCWNRWKMLQGTCAVASFPEGDSPLGLQDMAGNVWEWTSSGYSADYGHPPDLAARVNRGGCWYDTDPAYVRAAHRDRNRTTERSDYLGFRCAR
jgi:formylglycine-generating enzyme required for sulfatase activity